MRSGEHEVVSAAAEIASNVLQSETVVDGQCESSVGLVARDEVHIAAWRGSIGAMHNARLIEPVERPREAEGQLAAVEAALLLRLGEECERRRVATMIMMIMLMK